MPNLESRTVSTLATLALLVSALLPATASAQVAPRLVNYYVPGTTIGQCQPAANSQSRKRNVTWTLKTWREDIQVFGSTTCSQDTLLFTLSWEGSQSGPNSWRMKPTALGVAMLARQCGGSSWVSGTAQSISPDAYHTFADSSSKSACDVASSRH
ncbi:MAG TPA: hypothetical protein VNF68_07645 [Candidatus Baltobacteraceae bacterium]|nr:hypothetical protein [Candidatus Baltobacteraceae bacterium]